MGELEPGRDVGVVVESRDDDLVALAKLASHGSREHEVEVGHARAEDRFVIGAAEEPSRGSSGGVDQLTCAPARFEGAADVRVRLAQVAGNRIDDGVRDLRPSRSIQEDERALQRREPRPHGLDVQNRGAHSTRPLTRHW
jgi:hypothetical protein